MKAFVTGLCALALCSLLVGTASAQDDMQNMPMGAPEQMKAMHFLVGDWTADMKWRMSDTSAQWMDAKTTASYELVLDGGAVRGTTTIDMMGMTMTGLSLDCYDRERQEWQTMWIDDATPRIRLYTGNEQDGKMVMTGEEIVMGQKLDTRIIIEPKSDTEFYWEMQHSEDGGKSWWTAGKATYTKQG